MGIAKENASSERYRKQIPFAYWSPTARIVYDGTVRFCDRFLDKRSRTVDQMVQAARGKKNILYGCMASGNPKETEIKLVNVARASLEELLDDYRDFLRTRNQLPVGPTIASPGKSLSSRRWPARADDPRSPGRPSTTTARRALNPQPYIPDPVPLSYLAIAQDWRTPAAKFSRRVVGWSMSNSLATEVITAAMRKAIQARRPSAGTLFHHSDRGCQYTSESFQDLLRTLQITCSMSRTGCCYDNAVAERFFWSLKHEWTKFESYENLDDAKISVFKYIETFYNLVSLHQTLEYHSLGQFERKQTKRLVA
jgi:putative transposase